MDRTVVAVGTRELETRSIPSAQLYFICVLYSFVLWYNIVLFHVVVVQINRVIVNMSKTYSRFNLLPNHNSSLQKVP